MSMINKQSTYTQHIEAMSPARKKAFDEGYRELLLSEMLLAAMAEDDIALRKLAELAGVLRNND